MHHPTENAREWIQGQVQSALTANLRQTIFGSSKLPSTAQDTLWADFLDYAHESANEMFSQFWVIAQKMVRLGLPPNNANARLSSLYRHRLTTRARYLGSVLSSFPSLVDDPDWGNQVDRIHMLAGDPHRHNQVPLAVHFKHGEDQFFRNFPCGGSRIFSSLTDWVYQELGHPPTGILPLSGERLDSITLRRFLPADSQGDEIGLKRYAYLLGALHAIATLTKSIDLHFENLLCHNSMPIPVDSELVFTSKECWLAKDPLTSTGLLGRYLSGATVDTEFSAISCTLADHGVTFTRPHHSSNHVMVDRASGKVLDVMSCREKIVTGFEAGFLLLCRHRLFVRRLIDGVLANPAYKYRFLARSTAFYKAFQIRMWGTMHFAEACDEQALAYLNSKKRRLSHSALPSAQAELHQRELHSLVAGDIPFFWRDVDSFTLYGCGDNGVRGFFRRTLRTEIDVVLKHWSEDRLAHARKRLEHWLAALAS